jgi:amino acid transporter
LRRRLGLPLLVLYGTGITIGAGIYVLIGAVARHAGIFAPWSFLLAALTMALTVASYAELSTRYPVSAGEAAYTRAAFDARWLSTITGLTTVGIGAVSSAAVALGAAGYVQQFIDLPTGLIVIGLIVALGLAAVWGILESVVLAGIFTLIEVGGLLAIIVAALHSGAPMLSTLTQMPAFSVGPWSGIVFGSLLAFFAFVGFEDLANVVEEAKVPERDIPRAMTLTLLISTVLYLLVAAIAVGVVPIERLASSSAPLSTVFHAVAGMNPSIISAIAIVATLNTILAQMSMGARVIYGMARQGDLPAILGKVHPTTRTPLIATVVTGAIVVALGLAVSLERLAESTSLATLAVFAMVNLALLRIHRRKCLPERAHVNIPRWVPFAGFIICLAMMTSALLS